MKVWESQRKSVQLNVFESLLIWLQLHFTNQYTTSYWYQVCVSVCWWQVMKLTPRFTGWGLQQHTHGTRLPHSICSPIYENALSPDSWEAPACWSILLSCEGLVCEKGRCVQIWPLVTAGWPGQRTELLTSSHIVHSAVVVEIFSEIITSTIFLTKTDRLFSPDTCWGHLLFLINLYYCRLKQLQLK